MKRYFSPSTKKVIFFDINHTLVDQKQTFRKCFTAVLNEFTGRWSGRSEQWNPEDIVLQYEKEWAKARYTKRKAKLSSRKLKFACLRKALKSSPFEVNDEFLASFHKRIKQQQENHIQLVPHTIQTLTKLNEHYKLAIISNKANTNLNNIGLSGIFSDQYLFTPQNTGHRKPHLAIYKYALRVMKVKASEAVMVGDSWKTDIYGATGAGMDAIWIKQTSKKRTSRKKVGKQQVIMIRNLKELSDVF